MILSLLSGLFSALAFPTVLGSFSLPHMGFLIWFSLVPFYLSLKKQGFSFLKGFLFGVAFYGVNLYWFYIALHHYGEVPWWGSLLGVGAAVVIEALLVGLAAFVAEFLYLRGVSLAIVFSLTWVAHDLLRNFFPFGGFSWGSLAYSQSQFLTLVQISDVTGVFGINFLIVMANAVLAEIWLWNQRRRSFPVLSLSCFIVLFLGALIYGHFRLPFVRQAMATKDTKTFALVQGNIPQEEKWLEGKVEEIIARHVALTGEVALQKPDLVIWPEAAYPAIMPPVSEGVVELKHLKTPLLMGVVSYEGTMPEIWPPLPESDFRLHNSAVLLEPGGFVAQRYYKRHLVPMGEYVPLEKWIPFLDKIVPAAASFSPGKDWNLMTLDETKFGVTICYEDLFPEISRRWTRLGADYLVNLTNDGWYDQSSAIDQHFDFSRFRAVENRRAMVRVTNTGRTGVFSPTGEVLASVAPFQEKTLVAKVPLGGPSSFYTRHGDIFAFSCAGIVCLLLVATLDKRVRLKKRIVYD